MNSNNAAVLVYNLFLSKQVNFYLQLFDYAALKAGRNVALKVMQKHYIFISSDRFNYFLN